MLIYFSSPLPLGLASRAEYVTVCTDMKAKDFLPLYNKNCPEGLMGIAAVDVDENPNLQFRVVAAQYDFFTPLEKRKGISLPMLKRARASQRTSQKKFLKWASIRLCLQAVR